MLRSLTLAMGLAVGTWLGLSAASADIVVNGNLIEVPDESGVVVVVPGVTSHAVTPVPIRPTDCGVYRYWDGTRCADARFNPPSLNTP